jgi:hypothetical protein
VKAPGTSLPIVYFHNSECPQITVDSVHSSNEVRGASRAETAAAQPEMLERMEATP